MHEDGASTTFRRPSPSYRPILLKWRSADEGRSYNRLLVTGTDTGIGKTVVAAMLTIALDGYYWKPIQSGTKDGTDAARVAALDRIGPSVGDPAGALRPDGTLVAASRGGTRRDRDRGVAA